MSSLAAIRQAVIAGQLRDIRVIAEAGLAGGLSAREILEEALIPAMDVVGQLMREGEYFVPEVLVSARTMQTAVDLLKPMLVGGQAGTKGRVVIGTVKGDQHDIGKNLVVMMLQGAGFEVVDLGVNVLPDRFVAAVREAQPQLVALSAMLTTTMEAMKLTVRALETAGIREQVKVLVGGVPVTQEFADRIGADGYGVDATAAVMLAKSLVSAT